VLGDHPGRRADDHAPTPSMHTHTTDPAGLVAKEHVGALNVLLQAEAAVREEVGGEGERAGSGMSVSVASSGKLSPLTCREPRAGGG
jgi:hypothetical protein